MTPHPLSVEEVARLGEKLYDRDVRASVEGTYDGHYLVLDVETGEFEVDADEVSAVLRAAARHPSGNHYLLRVGRPHAFRIGGRFGIGR